MSYLIYIIPATVSSLEFDKGNVKTFTMEQWKSAINQLDCAKFDHTSSTRFNPETNEKIMIESNKGDVAIKYTISKTLGFRKQTKWVKSIFYNEANISFSLGSDEKFNKQLKKCITLIADKLDAKIIGEEGEEYNW